MPLVPKEVIRPGIYWYTDEKTGEPRKLVVTAAMTKRWHDEGNKMLSLKLPVPVPYEHDFTAHPMTPADRLKNNAGWVDKFEMRGDQLWSMVDIQDDEVAKKLPRTVRWTSPWINSFVDGEGRKWDGVISHLALTTRPRIVPQEPFGSIAAALSVALESNPQEVARAESGFCLSKAGLLLSDGGRAEVPAYPLAFSLWSGARFAATDAPLLKKPTIDPEDANADGTKDRDTGKPEALAEPTSDDNLDLGGLMDPTQDSAGDVQMEELLCDLLQALGVPMPDESNPTEFKRHLYEAAMSKIKELTSHGMAAQASKGNQPDPGKAPPDQNKSPQQNPNVSHAGKSKQQNNPLVPQVQQEQQPMYMSVAVGPTTVGGGSMGTEVIMSLEDIQKLEDPTVRAVALSMYNQNQQLLQRVEASERDANAMKRAKLDEESKRRRTRVQLLGKAGGPKVRENLEAMLSLQSMALGLDANGAVVDPMRATLDTLEAALGNMPEMLRVEAGALTAVPHPSDADALSEEGERALVDSLTRAMGGVPERQAS